MAKKKKEEQRVKKPFLISAISLIVMAVLTFASSLLSTMGLSALASVLSIFIFAGTILSFVGFYYLGRRHENKFLMRIIIAGFVLYMALLLSVSYVPTSYVERFSDLNTTLSERAANLEQLKLQNVSEEVINSFEVETARYVIEKGLPLAMPIIIGLLIFIVYLTFFGIAMIELHDVRNAKTIGILTIISAWLIPTLVGIFLAIPLSIAAYVLTVIMFFDESKRAKE